ncbi:MAG: sulfurtransferase complex subunit TusC [Alphaproteobacteria bacterium]|jgi:tRNA 2-thiouridine synthesizing protein C|nr:sulfurtransferase complex subunit TusC [Alphaproteobacteria bacterium]MDP6565530.1 sulfurtransferase complex subunit TusC [Alphaproteobacteria bacterium]MDP6815907.1 sulfurtransferase complex subunit TusC [Alphaproteobacteria bacterium]
MNAEIATEFDTEGVQKNFMFVNRKAPYGSIYALEALEMVLISAAFEQNAVIAFIDDGVYQIVKGQDTKAAGMKNFSPTFGVIEMEKEDADEDPDIDMVWRIVVERDSMEQRGLTAEDFSIAVEVLDSAELADLMNAQDVVLSA